VSRPDIRELSKKFTRFAAVGAFGVLVQYAVLIALIELFSWNAVIASGVGFLLAAGVNYYLNYRYTFESKKRHYEAFVKFSIIASAGLVLNSVIIAGCTELLALHYLLAQAVAIGVVLIWNFAGNLLWTFNDKEGG